MYFLIKDFKKNINAIYKSFFSDNLLESINAAKSLNFSGFALSMPFKIEILNYADNIDSIAGQIGSANTVLNISNKLFVYNTDWIGAKKFFLNMNSVPKEILIAGNGGFSRAVQYACNDLGINYNIVTRQNWSILESTDKLIFNATPAELTSRNLMMEDLFKGW